MFFNRFKQAIVVGFALFAMFFGGGNIIFPPYVGMMSGEKWLSAFCGYFIGEVGLLFLVLFALLKSKNYLHQGSIFARLGGKISILFMMLLILSVCLVVIPRTAVVSHDVLFGSEKEYPIKLFIFSLIYFSVSVFFAYRKTKLVDYIGKIFTPILLISLGLLILSAIINPFGSTNIPSKVDMPFFEGLEAGYQTMGFLGAPFFCVFVMNILEEKGYRGDKDKAKIFILSSLVVFILMFSVYFGLTYVGATAASSYNASVSHTELLKSIFLNTFGSKVSLLINVAITASCLSTAIALSSIMASFISQTSNHRLSYGFVLILESIIFTLIANLGIESIIKYASYVIIIIVPIVLFMIIFNFFESKVKNDLIPRIAIIFIIIEGVLEQLCKSGIELFSFISNIPLYNVGFSWVFFALVGAIIGYFIPYKNKEKLGSSQP